MRHREPFDVMFKYIESGKNATLAICRMVASFDRYSVEEFAHHINREVEHSKERLIHFDCTESGLIIKDDFPERNTSDLQTNVNEQAIPLLGEQIVQYLENVSVGADRIISLVDHIERLTDDEKLNTFSAFRAFRSNGNRLVAIFFGSFRPCHLLEQWRNRDRRRCESETTSLETRVSIIWFLQIP